MVDRWVGRGIAIGAACLVFVGTLLPAGGAAAAPSASGDVLWGRRYNGPGNGFDTTPSTAASPDGSSVFVTGGSIGTTTGYDYATIAYDAASGSVLWARRYNGPGNGDDYAKSVAVSPDGSKVFVTGQSDGLGTLADYATIAYDSATGSVLWARRYDGPGTGFDTAYFVAASSDGTRIFVTGGDNGDDYATIAYDAATGSVMWIRRYNGPGSGSDTAKSVAVSADGSRLFVSGESIGAGTNNDYATVAYDAATGAVLWTQRYNGPANFKDSATFVAISPDGSRVFVTGWSYGAGTFADLATIAYDAATGVELWTKRYNGPDNGVDTALAVTASPDGSKVFVAGESTGVGTNSDYVTIAYDAATGAVVWTRRYNGPGNDFDSAYAVGASPDGSKVFVTGESIGPGTSYEYATIAFDAASGAVVWTRRYNGPGNSSDSAYAVAVSPDGSRVFVTGQSYGSGTGPDFFSIAYEA